MARDGDPEAQDVIPKDPFLDESHGEAKLQSDNYYFRHILILTAIPFLLFCVVISMFTFGLKSRDLRVNTVIITALLLVGCFAVMLVPVKKTDKGEDYSRLSFYSQLSLLCILGIIAGAGLGFYNYSRHTSMYWAYEGQRYYTDVQPTDLALAHLDAGKLDFTKGTHVARNMSAGYAKDGSMYVVAPLVDEGPGSMKVEYFAAWTCLQRDEVNCQEAPSTQDHSGLVQLKKHAGHLSSYRMAALSASQTFGFLVSEDALFVSMCDDPDKAQQVYWNDGLYFLIGGFVLYLVISPLLAVVIHHISKWPPESRRRRKKYPKP